MEGEAQYFRKYQDERAEVQRVLSLGDEYNFEKAKDLCFAELRQYQEIRQEEYIQELDFQQIRIIRIGIHIIYTENLITLFDSLLRRKLKNDDALIKIIKTLEQQLYIDLKSLFQPLSNRLSIVLGRYYSFERI
ncbi:unnamed protein product [Paramecium sonneborni]|uniref:Uncharacterized protein n=1 Tax=Paramecium sonneborni TaxID=65129 RepID=A0A8S1P121_9CILI|nr:unnamed protein product [Paramecium sonneborni]